MGPRIAVLVLFSVLLYSALGYQMYSLQIERGADFSAQAATHHELAGVLTPSRGSIYFTNKEGDSIPVAINKEYPTIYAVPKEVEDPAGAAHLLSQIVDTDEGELLKALSKENDPFEPISKRATNEQLAFLEEHHIEGVHIGGSAARFYPLREAAAQLLGFSSVAEEQMGAGLYGVEAYHNDTLLGTPGSTEGDKLVLPENGEDVHLTIDRSIQMQAESILKELVEDHNAEGGMVIVEDPNTGKILAMAGNPGFDPNNYGSYDISSFLNPAVESVYEPGSIFKVITMAIGIETGSITPNTTYYDSGELTLNGHTIRNWDLKAYGETTMTQVIEHSLNTGAAFAESRIGHKKFYDYLVKFGLKKKTGVDLPGEIVGSLQPLEKDQRDINFATASFGQGISVTPISLITALSAIANGGELMRPYVNADLESKVMGRVISEDTSRQVKEMMVSAVDKAIIPAIEGYSVAGKTGTAQVPNFATGGYTDDVINTYIGFAPAYDPQFVVMVRLNKPSGAPLAGYTVVPAFRELAQFIINYYNIPPDRVEQAQ